MKRLPHILTLTCTACLASAATINVPADYATIKGAIHASSDGDVIAIAAGTYYEWNLNPQGRAITIRGRVNTDGELTTTIDAQGSGIVLRCNSGETESTIFEHLIITGGYSDYDDVGLDFGGGMCNESSNPTLNNCMFMANTAYSGGGMFNWLSNPTLNGCTFMDNTSGGGAGMSNQASSPRLIDCTFSNNTAENIGGAMINSQGTPMLEHCTFTNNTAQFGGAMYISQGSPTMLGCVLTANVATMSGGGIYSNSNSNPMLEHCTFENNIAGSNAGGMQNWRGSASLNNCTFTGNHAGNRGGGMYNPGNFEDIVLTDCTFTANEANEGGGIRHTGRGSLVGCRFEHNRAHLGGGMLIYHCGWGTSLNTCTFTGNMAHSGGGIANKYLGATITDCAFTANTADEFGGGMYNIDSNPTVVICRFTGNTAQEAGSGMYNDDESLPSLQGTRICSNTTDQLSPADSYDDDGGNTIVDECPEDCLGDFTDDGIVNVDDLLVVIAGWNRPYTVDDLLLVTATWHATCP